MRIVILFALLLLRSYAVAANSNYHFVHVTDGLPSQQVSSLAQDNDGNIWIGTRNGLCRYDGYSVKSYYHDNRKPNSLKHNFVRGLFVDSRKRLWVLTLYGVCRYRPETDDFRCYGAPGTEVSSMVESGGRLICSGNDLYYYDSARDRFVTSSFRPGFIISLAADRRGNVFISTNKAVYQTTSALRRFRSMPRHLYSGFTTGADGIIPLFVDSRGFLWIGRNGDGVVRVDPRTGRSTVFDSRRFVSGIVRVVSEDSRGRIWLGTEKGIAVLGRDRSTETIAYSLWGDSGLSDNSVYAILRDGSGNMWVGTYFGGVDVLLNNYDRFRWYVPSFAPGGLGGKVVRMMAEPEPGKLWVATEDGGVSILDTATGTAVPFAAVPGIGTNVHSLYYDSRTGDMWIGTFRNGLFRYNLRTRQTRRYYHERGLDSDAIFYIAAQRDGTIWVATTLGLRRYDPAADEFRKTGDWLLDTSFVYCLLIDSNDNVWAGSTIRGLFRIAARSGRVTHWNVGQSGLADRYITSLYQDRRGRIWIGTNNSGLQLMDKPGSAIRPTRIGSPLNNGTICSITGDSRGRIWIGTSAGLYEYDPPTRDLLRYTSANGLPSNNMNFSSAYASRDGRLYFGTVDGLFSFVPSELAEPVGRMTVHFKSLVVNDREILPGDSSEVLSRSIDCVQEVVLPYSMSRMFSIDYGVVRPAGAANVEYQVMVEGIDRRWRNVRTEHRFVGYNLDPGTYVLRIRANTSASGWDQAPVKQLKIVIKPPFYRSTLAYMFYLVLLAAVLVGIARVALERIRERNSLRAARMEKERIQAIDKAKFDFFTMMSHELKTPLTLISGPLRDMSAKNLNEDSRRDLDMAIENADRMGDMINKLITFNKVESGNFPFYVQKGDPVAVVKDVAGRFVAQASHKHVALTIECSDDGREVWFSQSYVEHIVNNLVQNAIKFTPDGGHIVVRADIEKHADAARYLHLEVEDDGIGISEADRDNIFRRYYQTKDGYGADASGWGIGLSLVKRLVETHKGTISVDSVQGEGSRFVVDICTSGSAFDDKNKIVADSYDGADNIGDDLPSDEAGPGAPAEPAAATDGRATVLAVDDNKDMLVFISRCLGKTYNVVTASNGPDALRIAREGGVDLVVSDVIMPVMDGVELRKRLKGDLATSHIPVILLTARSGREDIVNGYESGAEAYVPKPFSPYVLTLQIKNILDNVRAQQRWRLGQTDEEPEQDNLCEIDRNFIDRISKLVDENLKNSDFCIQDITTAMGISRSLLHNKMRSLVGQSMGDYIRGRRLDEARSLLAKGYNVSETAYQTGFTDPNHFSKMFKKRFGVNPSECMMQSAPKTAERTRDE